MTVGADHALPVGLAEQFDPASYEGQDQATAEDYDALTALALSVAENLPSTDNNPAYGKQSQFVRQAGLGDDTPRFKCRVGHLTYFESVGREARGLHFTIEQGRRGGNTPPHKERQGESVTLHLFMLAPTVIQTQFGAQKGPHLATHNLDIDGTKALFRQITDLIGDPETLVPAPTARERRQAGSGALGGLALRGRRNKR